ncbi:MAG TPA: cyclic pyranopterin monophosphate synthase MoaC [Acidimicrobiia bacterium]|nr:cyclic pyranopterin monophosphate synthase MoaC [Acidimicrobiia bacterium]
MTTCAFCGGTETVVGEVAEFERVAICAGCAEAFNHQLGHQEGACTNCGRTMPEAGRLHGEGAVTICEVCLTAGPDVATAPALTHLTTEGEVHMVDVGEKAATPRRAVAEALVTMSATLADRFFSGELPKGDALATVRLAGIMAAKRTPELIPLAHPISLTAVDVTVERHAEGVRIQAECAVTDRTGVEMEALTAVSVAALTLYDMVKSVERGVVIGPIRLVSKAGGRSGEWRAAHRE